MEGKPESLASGRLDKGSVKLRRGDGSWAAYKELDIHSRLESDVLVDEVPEKQSLAL